MKNTINKLLIILLVVGLAGCEADPVIYDAVNGQTLVSFKSSSGTLPVPLEGSSFKIPVEVSTVSDMDRTINVSVDASSTAGSAEYTINSATAVIPAGSYSGFVEVVGNFDEIPDSVITNLVLNLNGIEGTDAVLGRTQFNLSLLRKCDSNLDVAFTYVATDLSYLGTPLDVTITGSDALVKVAGEDSKYVYASGTFDFGFYCFQYNGGAPSDCGDGASGSLQLDDTCGKLSYLGADQYGDPWTISNVVVEGSDLTFTWESAFGESSRVTLTRTDGEDWQMVF